MFLHKIESVITFLLIIQPLLIAIVALFTCIVAYNSYQFNRSTKNSSDEVELLTIKKEILILLHKHIANEQNVLSNLNKIMFDNRNKSNSIFIREHLEIVERKIKDTKIYISELENLDLLKKNGLDKYKTVCEAKQLYNDIDTMVFEKSLLLNRLVNSENDCLKSAQIFADFDIKTVKMYEYAVKQFRKSNENFDI